MSELEFSLIIVSIICGIVITKVLGSLGDMIQGRKERPIYWVHVGWMLLVILMTLSYFRSEFVNESLTGFGFWGYTLAVLPYGFLVVLSHLLCPDLENMTEPDMDAWYYAHAPDFFRGFALFVATNAVIVNMLRGVPWLDPIRVVEALAIATALLVSRSNSRRVHSMFTAFFYIALLVSVKRWQ